MNIAANNDDYLLIVPECKEDRDEMAKMCQSGSVTLVLDKTGTIVGLRISKKIENT